MAAITNEAERQTQLNDDLYRSREIVEQCMALGLDIKRLQYVRILVALGDIAG